MLYSHGISALCSQGPAHHLRQYIYANANKLQFIAPYLGRYGHKLSELTRKSGVDYIFILSLKTYNPLSTLSVTRTTFS